MDKKYKLLALFREGATEGEKQAALEGLRKLCKKEGISLENFINQEAQIEKTIRVKSREEVTLIYQIIYTLFPNEVHTGQETIRLHYRTYTREAIFKGTPRQFMEVKYAFDVYKFNYRKEKAKMRATHKKLQEELEEQIRQQKDGFYQAFLYSNNLFPDDSERKKDTDLDPEELERLRKIWRQSRGITKTQLNRPIERGKVEEMKLLG